MPSEVRIGDSLLMISEVGVRGPMPAFLYVYVKDADATYRRALDAGARSLEEPADLPYGDRRSMFEDEWGNTWQVAKHLGAASRLLPNASRRLRSSPRSKKLRRARKER